MIEVGSRTRRSAWYNRSKSRSDSNVRPLSLMGSLTISSLSGSDLVKSLVNHHNHDSAEDEEDETAQGQGVHVNTYDTFMKKHLSSYGYYCNGECKVKEAGAFQVSWVYLCFDLAPIQLRLKHLNNCYYPVP